MGTIRNLSDRFKALYFELIKQQAIAKTIEKVPEYNRQQLKEGQFVTGQPIYPPLKSIRYALDKEKRNGLNGRSLLTPDLNLTGSFYEKIVSELTGRSILTDSLDIKATKLEGDYGKDIYGMNQQNTTTYAIEDVKPVLLDLLKSATVG